MRCHSLIVCYFQLFIYLIFTHPIKKWHIIWGSKFRIDPQCKMPTNSNKLSYSWHTKIHLIRKQHTLTYCDSTEHTHCKSCNSKLRHLELDLSIENQNFHLMQVGADSFMVFNMSLFWVYFPKFKAKAWRTSITHILKREWRV